MNSIIYFLILLQLLGIPQIETPVTRLIKSIETWTVYDFDEKRSYERGLRQYIAFGEEPSQDIKTRDILCKTLSAFAFNPKRDTIIISLETDVFGSPTSIYARSSKQDILFTRDDNRYIESPVKEDIGPWDFVHETIKENDFESFTALYNKYGSSDVCDDYPERVFRVEIRSGKIKKVSEWIFWFDYLKIYHESLMNSTRQNNR